MRGAVIISLVNRSGFFVACIFLLAAVGCARGPRVSSGTLDFNLPDLSGAGYSASDKEFSGKVLLVTLWGTWCPPCVSEIPTLNSIQAGFEDDGFAVVAIAFERDPDASARQRKLSEFVEEHQIGYLVLDGGTTGSFSSTLPTVEGVSGFPVEILIDRNGRVVDCRNGYGYSEDWALKLEDRISDLLYADR